ncbi:MAG: pilus assembly protein MshP [Gammaproteobacteria bacterium]|nr:pilus assembly protein MshP [Gammaproteobacteria bacterium]
MINPIKKTGGFSLIATLFILVVLALLSGYMVKISTVQHTSSALSVQASRVWYAAVSGLDWTVYQINGGGCPAIPSSFTAEGFTILVNQCDRKNIAEGSSSYGLYNVSVTASQGSFGDSGFVSRRLSAVVTGP